MLQLRSAPEQYLLSNGQRVIFYPMTVGEYADAVREGELEQYLTYIAKSAGEEALELFLKSSFSW